MWHNRKFYKAQFPIIIGILLNDSFNYINLLSTENFIQMNIQKKKTV